MGIIRDLIGGVAQQSMTSRGSNQRPEEQQYQSYSLDYILPQLRSEGRRARRCRGSRRNNFLRSSDQGYIGGGQITQLPQSIPPRLPPRHTAALYSSSRVYRSVLPSEELVVPDKGLPVVDTYSSGQSFRDSIAQTSYPTSHPSLPEYEEEDQGLDGSDGWYGLSVPVALPQAGFGQGIPFIRAYSDQLEDAGIPQRIFVEFLDALNATVIPNPETQIANKAAGLAGWFVPGAGGIALGLVQVGAQVGGAMHLQQATASRLQTANRTIFAPAGLEVLICKSQVIDDTVGCPNSFATSSPPGAGYIDKLLSYGSLLAPLTSLPPVNVGRSDLMAQLGAGLLSRSQQKTQDKAAKDMASGKMKRTAALDGNFDWVSSKKET